MAAGRDNPHQETGGESDVSQHTILLTVHTYARLEPFSCRGVAMETLDLTFRRRSLFSSNSFCGYTIISLLS
ncbi:hypothetical protein BaRGS_00037254, partial [Batillaria attramentaria]